jgi:acylphosphatase
MRIARRYLIAGRVQGVGFRYFAQRVAEQHGISGWVRNTPDGRVEIEAEGDDHAMHQFEHQVSTGPAGAHVDVVDTREISVGPVLQSGFAIR